MTNEKARAAAIFRQYWLRAKDHLAYLVQKKAFIEQYIHQLPAAS